MPSGIAQFQTTNSTLLEWKLPASTVCNLNRSFISEQWTLPAGGAGNYGVVYEDGVSYRWCYFGNGSGLGICDLQNVDCWVNTSRPLRTKLQDYLGADQLSQFYPCNQLATSNIFPFSRDGLTAGTANASTFNWTEPQHLSFSTAANTALNIYRYFPLSSFKDTILAMDKDLVFGQDMYLRLNSNYLTRMAFYTNTPANPNANLTAIAAGINVSQLYFYLAIEEELDIRASLLAALSAGSISLSIPYTFAYRFSSGASSTANLTLTLTKSYGRGLKRVMYVPYNAQELTQYAYDHSNANGTKVSALQTTMDGRPLTDYLLNCYNPYSSINPAGVGWVAGSSFFGDDYREIKKYLTRSVYQGYPELQSMWLYMDCWGIPCGDSPESDGADESLIQSYFDLLKSGDHVYTVQAQTPALLTGTNNCSASGLVNYIFCTFVRTLKIRPDGIDFEP